MSAEAKADAEKTDAASLLPGHHRLSSSSLNLQNRHTSSSREQSNAKPGVQAWRYGVFASAVAATLVLTFNVTITIWSALKYGVAGGVGTAIVGDCSRVDTWTTGLKTVINVLSTLLLGISGYTMQCLSSPTRQDLDRAHAAGEWMDIGVSGVRNLFRIRRVRVVIWWGLALSSIPIHLLYNSTIFKDIDAEVYTVVVGKSSVLTGSSVAPWYWLGSPGAEGSVNVTLTQDQISTVELMRQVFASNESDFQNLTNKQCIDDYARPSVAGRSNLLVVVDDSNGPADEQMFYAETVNSFSHGVLPYAWICRDSDNSTSPSDPRSCNVIKLQQHASNWTVNGRAVRYCLSQIQDSHCKMQFATYMMVAVIVCNAIKIACMLFTLFQHGDPILVTLGDAVTSYLQQPDELTTGRCLMTMRDIKDDPQTWSTMADQPPPAKMAVARTQRWYSAVSRRRWAFTLVLCTIVLLLTTIFLIIGAVNFNRAQGGRAFWSVGFGAVDSRALVGVRLAQSGTSALVASVLLANLPQTVLSFVYVAYNGLFTSMLLAREWDAFATKRKPLRVSSPQGEQRSTKWLQLPYKYTALLALVSSSLHFLVSDSLFLVRVTVYNNGAVVDGDSVSQLGWSPQPLLTTILLCVSMLIAAGSFGRRKLNPYMPQVGSCSVAIAAACHPRSDESDVWLSALRWGDVSEEKDDLRHATFSCLRDDELKEGELYAGLNEEQETSK